MRTSLIFLVIAVAIATAIALAGCTTPSPVLSPAVCPPLGSYDQAFRNRLAGELQALPQGTALAQAMLDYVALRDMIRACHGASGHRE